MAALAHFLLLSAFSGLSTKLLDIYTDQGISNSLTISLAFLTGGILGFFAYLFPEFTLGLLFGLIVRRKIDVVEHAISSFIPFTIAVFHSTYAPYLLALFLLSFLDELDLFPLIRPFVPLGLLGMAILMKDSYPLFFLLFLVSFDIAYDTVSFLRDKKA